MTRLQKKCLIAAAGTHLLVVVAVLCSGFIRPTPKTDNTTVLDVIPANLVDKALNTGVENPQTPPPPTPPQPQPPTPQPQVQPPTPTPPTPEPPKPESFLTKIEKAITPDLTPVDKTPDEQPKPQPQKRHEVKVDLTKAVRNVSQNDTSAQEARQAKREREKEQKAINDAVRNLSKNFSTATTKVELKGISSASSANYGEAVKAAYYHAWIPPQNMSSDSVEVGFLVTIARDGTVVSSHITKSSGDADIDRAVQQMLDRVPSIAPFPDGAEDNQRTYPILFDATRESLQ